MEAGLLIKEGKFLAAMFGWDARPSVEQIVAWTAFAVPVTSRRRLTLR